MADQNANVPANRPPRDGRMGFGLKDISDWAKLGTLLVVIVIAWSDLNAGMKSNQKDIERIEPSVVDNTKSRIKVETQLDQVRVELTEMRRTLDQINSKLSTHTNP